MIKYNSRISTITKTATLSVLMALAGLLLIGNSGEVHAVTSTLTLTIDSATVRANIAPTNDQGTFKKATASTLTASTDNATGYTLTIAAPPTAGTDYDKLVNTTDNTAKINSISSPTTEEQYKALSNTSYNNTWGYLPSKYCSDGTSSTCTTNTDFLPAPTIAGDVLDQTTTANTTANTYTIGMGTRIDSTTKTGKYQGSFIVKLVANAIPYTITYIDDSVSNMPIDVDTTTPDTSVNISSTAPTRNGYTFIGWCTVAPTINADGTDTCSGTQYNAGATITINQTGTNNDYTLHAMWSENYSIANVTYMQDFASMTADKSSKVILSMVSEQSYTLKDNRDETPYQIAKLKDGNVWMVENLNLAGDSALSADNTDVDATYINSFTTSNNLTKDGNTIKLPASATTGFGQDNYSFVYNSGNTTNCGISGQDTPCYSYYSWDAATLGSGRAITTENTDAPYSICPKGWRLPTSGSSSSNEWKRGDFYKLATAYGANLESAYIDSSSATGSNFYNNAGPGTIPGFLLAGRYLGGSFLSGESYYWSSTSSSDTNSARSLNFNSSRVYSGSLPYRSNGLSVRCLFSGR